MILVTVKEFLTSFEVNALKNETSLDISKSNTSPQHVSVGYVMTVRK